MGARYRVTDKLLQEDLEWLDNWRRVAVYQQLLAWRKMGRLEVRPKCEAVAINASHTWLRRRTVEEVVPAELVVVAKGFQTDDNLVSSMGFPAAEVDPTTGETSLPGIFAIGFDPPGSGTHHFGRLPGGKFVYDNWLCWGGAAADATCREVALRV